MVLITGASGFLGAAVGRTLTSLGYAVRGLVRRPSSVDASFTEIATFEGLHDRLGIRRALAGVNSVVHLAARVHVMRDTDPNPESQFQAVNVDGSRTLFEEAAAQGVLRWVFASSVKAVGGAGDACLTEATPCTPTDAYGRSKRDAEKAILADAENAGASATILRLPLVYGPGMKGNMLSLFRHISRGLPVPVGTMPNRRSIVYSGNVARAVEGILRSTPAASGVYFVADDAPLSTREMSVFIASGMQKRARFIPIPSVLVHALGMIADVPGGIVKRKLGSAVMTRLFGSLEVTASALHRDFGHLGFVPSSAGLEKTANWFTKVSQSSESETSSVTRERTGSTHAE